MIVHDAIYPRNCCKVLICNNFGGVKLSFEHTEATSQEERLFALIEVCRPTSGSLIVRAKAVRPIGLFDRNRVS
jgi:hypothetical protein